MGKSSSKTLAANKVTVFIAGYPGSGKSSLLRQLDFVDTSQEPNTEYPFESDVIEVVNNEHVQVISWNFYESRSARGVVYMYSKKDVVIMVVDSSSKDHEVTDQLDYLRGYAFKGSVVAILANKQDLPGALTVQEINDVVSQEKIMDDKTWKVFPAVCTTGEGLADVHTWISSALAKKRIANALFVDETIESEKRRGNNKVHHSPLRKLVSVTKRLFLNI